MNALYSIFLPVRDGGAYIKESVQSVLNQTTGNWELNILIHDSRDGTIEWLQSLKDDRIFILSASGINGITGNWSRISACSKKTFLTILGYDDILHPNYLAEMEGLIRRHPEAGLYQSHFRFIDAKGGVVRDCMPMPEKLTAAEFLRGQLTQSMDSMGTGYMMRSADYDAMGGIPVHFPNLIFADYALWLQLTEKSYLAINPKTTFDYRIHNSVSRVTNGEDYQKAFFLYLDLIKERMAVHPAIKTTFLENGHGFMMSFCESLSHRILKTPADKREITVKEFVNKCTAYAAQMLPDQPFRPLRRNRISLAVSLDQNGLTRLLFKIVKQMTLLFGRKV